MQSELREIVASHNYRSRKGWLTESGGAVFGVSMPQMAAYQVQLEMVG